MKKELVQIALCQRNCVTPGLTTSAEQKKHNLAETERLVAEAVSRNPQLDLIMFPEYNYFAPLTPQLAVSEAEDVDGQYLTAMAALAKKYGVNLLPGTLAEKATATKCRNSAFFFDRKGEIVGRYSKIHLMDAIGVKESDNTIPGSELCVLDTDFGRVGIMVCFDLRFPELARSMVLQGADMVLCMANFPFGAALPPRTDHWDMLVQSTALYNLTWVCAVNQYGEVAGSYPFGRSQVVDPWGTMIAQAGGHEDIVYATLDMKYQDFVRKRVATWENRRKDVYTL